MTVKPIFVFVIQIFVSVTPIFVNVTQIFVTVIHITEFDMTGAEFNSYCNNDSVEEADSYNNSRSYLALVCRHMTGRGGGCGSCSSCESVAVVTVWQLWQL